MADETEKLTQFTAITGASEDRARFFLESSAGELEIALSRYYESEGGDDVEEIIESLPQRSPEVEMPRTPSPTAGSKPKPKPKSRNSNFATLNSLARSSDDEEEEGQAFYAGGSEHSGQQVLGPPKKKDFVADMFKSVQEHGVEILDPGASTSGGRAFKGTGYKLGASDNDTVVVPGVSEPPAPREVTLKLWKEGFSLDDGEVRSYSDPANRDFLESIKRGEIPHELRQGTSEVHLAMEDHRMEMFKASDVKRITKPFTGQGYTLGSPTPPVVGASSEEDKPVNEAKAREEVKLDSSQPTTNIQIRLADGTRLVGVFNHGHTIGDLRHYITTARPQYQIHAFNLLTSYPSRVLKDTETIEEAGLLNSAIMQKLI